MLNYNLVKVTIIEAAILTSFTAGIGWGRKKVTEREFYLRPQRKCDEL